LIFISESSKLKLSCLFIMGSMISGIALNLAYADDSMKLNTSFKVIAETCGVVVSNSNLVRDLGNIELSRVAGRTEDLTIFLSGPNNDMTNGMDLICESSKKAKVRVTAISPPCLAYNGKTYSCGNEGQSVGINISMMYQKPSEGTKWYYTAVPGGGSVTKEVHVEDDGVVKFKLYTVDLMELENDGASPGNISAEYAYVVYND
ncbi:hypothetical protein, partial [Aeromonas jandaei]|uniref:hypothetical protein n=1 Tax=Aeromonas jandaei TaxID=650 RepID=UPI002AA0D4E2